MSEQATVQEPADMQPQPSSVDNGVGDDAQARSSHVELLSDAKRYRKRAQAAEKVLEDLKHDLAERDQRITQQEQTIADLQRRQKVDELLLDAEVIDLEAARLLAEMAAAEMPEPDIETAVSELRRRKPYLFRVQPSHRRPGAMSPRSQEPSQQELAVSHAAAEASATGKRSDVLRYLRLRRKT